MQLRVLLTGGSGFIGSRLREALLAAGHQVVCAGRSRAHADPRCVWFPVDFAAPQPPRWSEALRGVDAVVNAVGIFREHGTATFAALHVRGPIALFDACVAAGVARVVQVSALGADAEARTAYHLSKRTADDHLLALPLDATVVQPSLVFGPAGASARVFLGWAALPLLPLPAGGRQPVQPIHIDDAVAALQALLEAPPGQWRGRRVALVGPHPLALADYLQALRLALGLAPARTLSIPAPLMAAAATLGERVPGALLDRDAWQMLQRGNVGSTTDITRLLGAPPRAAHQFIAPAAAGAARTQAQLGWLLPVLRGAVAIVWIVTGIVSLGLYPVADSYALLARTGVPAVLQPAALYGAALLDLVFGVLTLAPLRRRRWLWAAQAALILAYTAIITVRLPEFWLHPYGPLTKNLPLLAVLLLLWTLEPRRGR